MTNINLSKTHKKECRMFKKTLAYNIKKAYIMIGLAFGLVPTFTACEKNDNQPQHYNTTYPFDINASPDTVSMAKDGKNELIDTVFYKFDGKSLNGAPSRILLKYYIGPASRSSSKFNGGKSVINGCYIDTKADSTTITKMDYKFINSWVGGWDVDIGR